MFAGELQHLQHLTGCNVIMTLLSSVGGEILVTGFTVQMNVHTVKKIKPTINNISDNVSF